MLPLWVPNTLPFLQLCILSAPRLPCATVRPPPTAAGLCLEKTRETSEVAPMQNNSHPGWRAACVRGELPRAGQGWAATGHW